MGRTEIKILKFLRAEAKALSGNIKDEPIDIKPLEEKG